MTQKEKILQSKRKKAKQVQKEFMQLNKSKVVSEIITDNSQKTEINNLYFDDITDYLEYSNILSYKIYIKNHKLGKKQ